MLMPEQLQGRSPCACVRSGGGAAARAGRRLWAWKGVFPGAGFWKLQHFVIIIM